MIITVTLNPAIDKTAHVEKMIPNGLNRLNNIILDVGGKGINVSMVLSELGIKSKAFGFVAGFTGKAIEEGVSSAGIETDFVHLDKGFSRINVKIKSSRETELNAQGPEISKEKIDELFRKLDEIQSGDTIVLPQVIQVVQQFVIR